MTNIEDFNYNLPDSQIARYPVTPHESSKLLETEASSG
jgi:S-adenosylmethionine:tRNA-ribosyltransferase-isomerase (queuine synthetase)